MKTPEQWAEELASAHFAVDDDLYLSCPQATYGLGGDCTCGLDERRKRIADAFRQAVAEERLRWEVEQLPRVAPETLRAVVDCGARIAVAVAEEREACARICESIGNNLGYPEGASADAAAETIRARSVTSPVTEPRNDDAAAQVPNPDGRKTT